MYRIIRTIKCKNDFYAQINISHSNVYLSHCYRCTIIWNGCDKQFFIFQPLNIWRAFLLLHGSKLNIKHAERRVSESEKENERRRETVELSLWNEKTSRFYIQNEKEILWSWRKRSGLVKIFYLTLEDWFINFAMCCINFDPTELTNSQGEWMTIEIIAIHS